MLRSRHLIIRFVFQYLPLRAVLCGKTLNTDIFLISLVSNLSAVLTLRLLSPDPAFQGYLFLQAHCFSGKFIRILLSVERAELNSITRLLLSGV